MTLVDFIDLEHDEWYVKVDVIDLSSDEDTVEKDGNVEGEEEEDDDNVHHSENLAEAATSSPISEQDTTATASLSLVDHGSAMASLMAEKSRKPENQEFHATSDVTKEATQPGSHELIAAGGSVGEAMQSDREAGIFSSMTEQAAATSLLLTKQGAITSLLKEDKSTQSANQVFVAAVDCAEEPTQSENRAKAVGSPSMTGRGATCKSHCVEQLRRMIGSPHIIRDGLDLCISHGGGHPHAEPGSSTVPCTKSEVSIKQPQEEPEGDTDKDENHDFEAETESLSPQDKENETSRLGKFYDRKGKKQVNTSTTSCNRQLSSVHSKGVPPTLHNGDSGFSVMGNVRNGTTSIASNVLDSEVVMSTSQGNTTMYGKVSNGCVIQGCTNSEHGGTHLCIIHNSRPHMRCCAVIGCTKRARASSHGRTDRCIKHGGGKRCKYDGCGSGAEGKTYYCIAHGGGSRCKFQGCSKGGRRDYCLKHGGGRRSKFLGRSASTCGEDLCSMHITSLLSGNKTDHEMMPAPAPACQAKMTEPSKRRNSHSVIGERSQKRQNTTDYVNTVVETGEKKVRVFLFQNDMLKAQQRTHRLNSEIGLAAGSPSPQLASTSPTTVLKF